MRVWHLWAALLCGCSFVIDLEGPTFTDPPPMPDAGIDLAILDVAIIDQTPPDMTIDAQPDLAPPPPPTFELRTATAAPVVVHTAAGDVRLTLDAAERFAISTTDGEALTARFDDTLITLLTVPPGGFAAVRPALSSGESTTMRLQLGSGVEEADGYAVSNGCRHLPCEGEGCQALLAGELSLSISDRCAADARVSTLAVAFSGGIAQAWKVADNPVPEESGAPTEFGDWQDDFQHIEVLSPQPEGIRVYAAPWNLTPYLMHLTLRSAEDQPIFRIPTGYAPAAEIGIEGPQEGTQRFRWWRALPIEEPVVLDVDRLLPVPTVVLTPDEGGRPTIEWSGEDAPLSTLARIEYVWEVEDERYRWILFAPASRGVVQLPALPEEWARWRPDTDTVARSAQVRWIRCKGNSSLADHYQTPCALFGPTARPAQVDDWLSWSLGSL